MICTTQRIKKGSSVDFRLAQLPPRKRNFAILKHLRSNQKIRFSTKLRSAKSAARSFFFGLAEPPGGGGLSIRLGLDEPDDFNMRLLSDGAPRSGDERPFTEETNPLRTGDDNPLRNGDGMVYATTLLLFEIQSSHSGVLLVSPLQRLLTLINGYLIFGNGLPLAAVSFHLQS